MLEVFSFCDRERAKPPSKKNYGAGFAGEKKYYEVFRMRKKL